MSNKLTQAKLLNVLRVHAPIKARDLAAMLASEFGLVVDRGDVNSMLYQLKGNGSVEVDKEFRWSALGVAGAMATSVTGKVGPFATQVRPKAISVPTITFTPEQQMVIDLDPQGDLLIRGQAGSGKTTILAARAGRILSVTGKGSLLFLTYNSALSAYVKKAFRTAGTTVDVEVMTFHEWARRTALAMGVPILGWVDGSQRSQKIKLLIEQIQNARGSHRLYQLEQHDGLLDWWGDEIAWMFGQNLTDLQSYLGAERTGRGTAIRLSKEDRRFVWYIFNEYSNWLQASQQADYDGPAAPLLQQMPTSGARIPEALRFDHLMIDEVQDFDRSWLLAVRHVPRVSLSMAGDMAQKIYKRSFSWSSVGIHVAGGRSRTLLANFRTTRQIMLVAANVLVPRGTASDEVSTIAMPVRNGENVRFLTASSARDAYELGYAWISKNFKRHRTATIAVALPFSRQIFPAKKTLEKLGVSVKSAKGASLGAAGAGVVITTYHQLKGLEFDHVVIMGLHDGQYPGRLLESIPEEDQPEEELLLRRVLYMAMTRAKQTLTLVGGEPFCRFFNDLSGSGDSSSLARVRKCDMV